MSDSEDEIEIEEEVEEEPVPIAPRRSTRILGQKRQRDERNPAAYVGRWDIRVEEVEHSILNFFGTAVIQLKEGGMGQFRFERKMGDLKVRKELDEQGSQVEFIFEGVHVAEGDEMNKEHAKYTGEGSIKVNGTTITGTFASGGETLHFEGSKSKLPFEAIEIPGPEEEEEEGDGWNI